MNKGDLINIYFNGMTITVCIVGFYVEEVSGQEIALLAVVPPDSLFHIPTSDLASILNSSRLLN